MGPGQSCFLSDSAGNIFLEIFTAQLGKCHNNAFPAAKWSSWKTESKEPMDLCAICVGQQYPRGQGMGEAGRLLSLLDS